MIYLVYMFPLSGHLHHVPYPSTLHSKLSQLQLTF